MAIRKAMKLGASVRTCVTEKIATRLEARDVLEVRERVPMTSGTSVKSSATVKWKRGVVTRADTTFHMKVKTCFKTNMKSNMETNAVTSVETSAENSAKSRALVKERRKMETVADTIFGREAKMGATTKPGTKSLIKIT